MERGLLLFTSRWSPRVQNHPRRIPGARVERFVTEALVAPGTRSLVSSSFLRIYEEGERIPVTIESSDPERGPVNIVVESAATNHAPAELARNRRSDSRRGWSARQAVRDRKLRHRGGGRRWRRRLTRRESGPLYRRRSP